jgi:hypothetical protein
LYVVVADAADDDDGYAYGYAYGYHDDDPVELFLTRGKWWELIVKILGHYWGSWECCGNGNGNGNEKTIYRYVYIYSVYIYSVYIYSVYI